MSSSLLQIKQLMIKHLQSILTINLITLSNKLYPTTQNFTDPYIMLFFKLKTYISLIRPKGLSLMQIIHEIINKANHIDTNLGYCIENLFNQEEFIRKFQCHNNHEQKENQQNHQSCLNQQNQQNQKSKQKQQNLEPQKTQNPKQQQQSNNSQKIINDNTNITNNNNNKNKAVIDLTEQQNEQQNKSQSKQSKLLKSNIMQIQAQHVKISQNSNKIIQNNDLKRIQQRQKILNHIPDPFSSARRADESTNFSPIKQSYKPAFISSSLSTKKQQNNQFVSSKLIFSSKQNNRFVYNSFSSKQISDRYVRDQYYIRNLSNRQVCLCETSCENIVLSEDSFVCVHCQNVYHTRCMRKSSEAKNCLKCHMKYLLPNKTVHREILVCLLKKGLKKHQINFNLNDQILQALHSKKFTNFRLQLRCFRLKPTANNIILFPDSCSITLNNKQLKEFKPLHKQSSLKYRKDEPVTILKNYQTNNKLIVTQFMNQNNSQERIEPEDHLIGLYLIQEKSLNDTIDQIIRNCVTTFKESKDLLQKNFSLNSSEEDSENDDDINCEVLKIPLTCALTTEKLKYPARGLFCRHFQCFDLRNFIMITSSSTNPKWICPLCKSSCYKFRVDCILAQILQNYSSCKKAEQIMLYKDGKYEILDKEDNRVNERGQPIKQSDEKYIDDLAIIDKNKRERQDGTQEILFKKQQEQPQKRKKVQLPPEDQIIVLSD